MIDYRAPLRTRGTMSRGYALPSPPQKRLKEWPLPTEKGAMRSHPNPGRSVVRGAIQIGTVVWLILVVGGGYAGWQFAQPWFRYLHFKEDASATVKLAQVLSESAMRQRIDKIAEDAGIWIDNPEQEIHLTYGKGHARVQAVWSEAAEFPFGIEYWFDFRIDTQG